MKIVKHLTERVEPTSNFSSADILAQAKRMGGVGQAMTPQAIAAANNPITTPLAVNPNPPDGGGAPLPPLTTTTPVSTFPTTQVLIGLLVGGGIGAIFAHMRQGGISQYLVYGGIVGIIGGAVGYYIGNQQQLTATTV